MCNSFLITNSKIISPVTSVFISLKKLNNRRNKNEKIELLDYRKVCIA